MAKKRGHRKPNKTPQRKNGNRVSYHSPSDKLNGKDKSVPAARDGRGDRGTIPKSVKAKEERLARSDRDSGDNGKLLTQPLHIPKDARLLERAIRNRWGIRNRLKKKVIHRLETIIDKVTVDVMTKAGPYASDGVADANATAAARVLVAINGQDQADDFEETKNPPAPVNVNVYNQNNIQTVDARTVELAKLAESFGARELVIEGKKIEPQAIIRDNQPSNESVDRASAKTGKAKKADGNAWEILSANSLAPATDVP